jgi:putative transposase
MLLGFKTELKLNNRQRILLASHCGVARHAWNWGLWLTKNILDHNKTNPNEKLKFPTAIDLHKLLVALVKSENQWYYVLTRLREYRDLRRKGGVTLSHWKEQSKSWGATKSKFP